MQAQPELVIDREESIKHNIDCFGRKWVITKKPFTPSLVVCRPEVDREDAVIPKQMIGDWTSRIRLQEQLNIYLKQSWDKADAALKQSAAKAREVKAREAEKKAISKPKPLTKKIVTKEK